LCSGSATTFSITTLRIVLVLQKVALFHDTINLPLYVLSKKFKDFSIFYQKTPNAEVYKLAAKKYKRQTNKN
jgi:hypothetical protein